MNKDNLKQILHNRHNFSANLFDCIDREFNDVDIMNDSQILHTKYKFYFNTIILVALNGYSTKSIVVVIMVLKFE